MKKITSLLLAILLITSILASCDKGTAPQGDTIIPDQPQQLESGEPEAPENEAPENEAPENEAPENEAPENTPTEDEPASGGSTSSGGTSSGSTSSGGTSSGSASGGSTSGGSTSSDSSSTPSELVVNVTPTNFERLFSAENERLLSTILSTPVQSADVSSLLPTMPISHCIKEPAGNGGYTYVYINVVKSGYNSCCSKILSSGYAQYTKNEISGKAYNDSTKTVNNYFATFVSAKAQIDIDFHESTGRMYINITPRSASVLPQREAKSYVKPKGHFPTIFVQYGLEDIDTGEQQESSMGYIMRLADGTFLLIDGGEYYDGVETRIYDILKTLAPDPSNIVITAWILTHGHYDHVGGFMKFADKYANDPTVKVKQVVTNFPDDSNCTQTPLTSAHYYVRNATAKLKAETLKPHTGNVLYYADVKINILYSQENYLANNSDGIMGNYNGASLVMQIVTAQKTKIFIAADHPVDGYYDNYNWCEGAIYKWYGTAIQSYVTTTFHHGYGGGADNTVYGVIDARITLWDCDYARSLDVASFECNQFFLDRPATSIYQCYMSCGSSVTILSFNNHMAFATVFPNFPTYQTAMYNIAR